MVHTDDSETFVGVRVSDGPHANFACPVVDETSRMVRGVRTWDFREAKDVGVLASHGDPLHVVGAWGSKGEHGDTVVGVREIVATSFAVSIVAACPQLLFRSVSSSIAPNHCASHDSGGSSSVERSTNGR